MNGKTMPFKSDDGVDHPGSYWCLTELIAGTSGVRFTIQGWHSLESYEAGAQPMLNARKDYYLPASIISDHADLAKAISDAAWQIALQTKDVGHSPTPLPQPVEEPRKSFFDGATDAGEKQP